MVRYVTAAVVGLIAGVIVAYISAGNTGLAAACGLTVMSVFFCEAALMHRMDALEAKCK